MTMVHEITTPAGVPIDTMPIGLLTPGTHELSSVLVRNAGDEAADGLAFVIMLADGATTGDNSAGAEVVAEGWIQARIAGDPDWVSLTGIESGECLDIPPMAAGATVEIELRAVVPADAATVSARFSPRVFQWGE